MNRACRRTAEVISDSETSSLYDITQLPFDADAEIFSQYRAFKLGGERKTRFAGASGAEWFQNLDGFQEKMELVRSYETERATPAT